MHELESIITQNNIDIIALTEIIPKTFSKDTKAEDFKFGIKGYTTINCHSGRGLCIFIKDNIQFDRIVPYETIFETSLFIKVTTVVESFTLGLIYRSPNSTEAINNNLLKQLHLVANEHKSCTKKLLL